MIFLSSGHNSQSTTIKKDPGAVNKYGVKEGDLTIEFKRMVQTHLDKLGGKYISDTEEENLSMWLSRAKTGSGSVVLEFHFDAATSSTATGATAIIGSDADRLDRAFAKELVDETAAVFGIKNRGVISESASHRGKLGLMREQGIVALLELGFITNPKDLAAYNLNKYKLAWSIAYILMRYESMIP